MATEAQIAAQEVIAEDVRIAYDFLTEEQVMRTAQAVERAANYPAFGDGLSRPVTISNITEFTDKKSGQRRVVINLCAKTRKSYGQKDQKDRKFPMPNANLSQPAEWTLRWKAGDIVCMFIEDGEVKKLHPASAMQAEELTVNKKVVAATEKGMVATQHGKEAVNVDTETGEVAPAADATKGNKGTKPAAVVAPNENDDLPF